MSFLFMAKLPQTSDMPSVGIKNMSGLACAGLKKSLSQLAAFSSSLMYLKPDL